MSYVGYIPLVKQFIHQQIPQDRAPTVLEIGIDKGTTLIPLAVFLARTRQQFTILGVDIKVQESVGLILSNLDLQAGQHVFCVEGNSLEVLPQMVEQKLKYDVVLLDGDHNYHTVSRELAQLDDLIHPTSLIIIDDYDGRWSEKDLWYAERPGYEDVKIATAKVETEKHGVKPAVDEWLAAHPEWQKAQPVPGEPVLLLRMTG